MPEQTIVQDILHVLQRFQDGYSARDVSQLKEFMQLFDDDTQVEVIGTNGIRPGVEEWYRGKEAASDMIRSDWESWGDLVIDDEKAQICSEGNVAWLSAPATVTKTFSRDENLTDYLDFVRSYIEDEQLPPAEKLLYILRGGTNTLYEFQRGETFVWPLRFTAVLVNKAGSWKFCLVQFSMPTVFFPDVREV